MRAQLRLFGDDDCIHVRYAELVFGQQVAYAFQKSQARNIFPFRIGVRKMRADVAKPRSAEQRVADRVRQRVAVGVSHGSFVKWNFDAAEDQFAAFREAVKVVANPRSRHRAWGAPPREKKHDGGDWLSG